MEIAPLYAILDPEQVRTGDNIGALVELLGGGVQWLQLRVKTLPPCEFFALAQRARHETRARGCTLIINDRLDIALAADADGVHLGQDDLPLAAARRLLPDKIIGISTHDVLQAREAEADGADYIGFGPLFGSATKETGYSARGLEMLRELRAQVRLPIAAIGGITEENVAQVWQAGADAAAIISDILRADDISGKVRAILRRRQSAAG